MNNANYDPNTDSYNFYFGDFPNPHGKFEIQKQVISLNHYNCLFKVNVPNQNRTYGKISLITKSSESPEVPKYKAERLFQNLKHPAHPKLFKSDQNGYANGNAIKMLKYGELQLVDDHWEVKAPIEIEYHFVQDIVIADYLISDIENILEKGFSKLQKQLQKAQEALHVKMRNLHSDLHQLSEETSKLNDPTSQLETLLNEMNFLKTQILNLKKDSVSSTSSQNESSSPNQQVGQEVEREKFTIETKNNKGKRNKRQVIKVLNGLVQPCFKEL